jgi:hypothetical protein
MKKMLFSLFALLISAPTYAQQDQGGSTQSSQSQPGSEQSQPESQPQGNQSENRQQRFQNRKQSILDRINRRINTLQDAKSCVEQAQDPQALKACRPQSNEDQGE